MAEDSHTEHLEWSCRINVTDYPKLGHIREHPDIQVCRRDNSLWLYGKNISISLKNFLMSIHEGEFFIIGQNRRLFPEGSFLSEGSLPDGPWFDLIEWLQPVLPPAQLAGNPLRPLPLKLVRTAEFSQPTMLQISIDHFYDFCLESSNIRLNHLKFVLSKPRQVLISGFPLPSLGGRLYVVVQGIAVPAGWTWHPPIDPLIIREALKLYRHDIAMFSFEQKWEVISGDAFVQVRRSALMETMRRFTDE